MTRLLLLTLGLAATTAVAGEPPPPSAPVAEPAPPVPAAALPAPAQAKLRGRVFEQGSLTVIPGARVTASSGEVVFTGDDGRFELTAPPGKLELVIQESRHEPLRLVESLTAGQGLTVDYRLEPLPPYKIKYQTTVRGEARQEGSRFSLSGDEARHVAGGLGQPLAVVGLLPGVAAPIPVLPLWVVRGASPGANGFVLDGMRVPQLFHLLLIGQVVHPLIVDRMDFFPGNFSAAYGRAIGGIIDAETRGARRDAPVHLDLQLRIYDLQALGEFRLPGDVRIVAAGKFGYPTPLINLVQKGVEFMYWDYLFRADWKGLTLEAIGSFDRLTLPPGLVFRGNVAPEVRVSFHRLQLRERFRRKVVELEAAIVGGVDEMAVLSGQGVRKLALNGRFNLKLRFGDRVILHGGVEGEVSRFEPANFGSDADRQAPDQLGEFAGTRDGVIGGAFLQLTAELWRNRLYATAGIRSDVYSTFKVTLLGFQPRAILRLRLLDELWVKAAVGFYQQPPSFPIALPGIDTYALQLGFQESIQGSGGVEARLPGGFSFDVTGFYQKMHNVNDVVADLAPALCTSPPPDSLSGLPATVTRQLDGQAFGLEVLLRRREGRVTGWISYTLSRSERVYSCGLNPADTDQSHILNLVVQAYLPWRLVASARVNVATGRPYTRLTTQLLDQRVILRNNDRFPTYFQLDLRVDREWLFKRWALGVFLEMFNSTFSQSTIGVDYPEVQQRIRYDMPKFVGVTVPLPSLGLTARF